MNSNLFLLTTLLGIAAYTGSGQPFITTLPQSQTNVAGATVTFSVIATDPLPLSYQWQFNSLDLASKTNTTLVLTNVQTINAGPYTVFVTDSAGATTSAVATLTMLVPPTISYFAPSNQSLSLGASPSFSITARGTPPLYYSLRFNDTDLPGKTNTGSFFSATLVGLSIQSTNTGFYTAVVTNLAGATTSQAAQVSVDPTFTKITSGPIANDLNFSAVAAWGDFSNDGFLDLFVCGYEQQNVFYHNDGDGMFTKSTQGDPVQDVDYHIEPAAGDYDNDGHLDLLVSAGTSAPTARGNRLYHNNGDSTFTPVSGGGVTNLLGFFGSCAWGDYDNDGLLDFFVANHGDSTEDGGRLLLCHNNGDATFTQITSGEVVTDLSVAYGAMWADYDNDGFMDLFVVNLLNGSRNLLYHNERNGTFARVLTNAVATDLWPGGALGAAWGDYDNDGFLDLFVTDAAGMRNRLYHNLGHGVFTNLASGPMLFPPPNSKVNGAAWGDYDNDGFLDLFVTYIGAKSALFHNNGDSTFTQIFTGSPVDDGGPGFHCKAIAWVDYDNDGFLDLFVTVSNDNFFTPNVFYHNNGNKNGWLEVKLVGQASNRSAIGAKVRVHATIGGRTFWQLREINKGGGFNVQPLVAHFGLGDATNVDLVRIEWPSGIVQTLTNVAPRQILTVVEHQITVNPPKPPKLTIVPSSTNGLVSLTVSGDSGLLYVFERSSNLSNWTWLGVRSNATGTIHFTDMKATNFADRFYRVSIP